MLGKYLVRQRNEGTPSAFTQAVGTKGSLRIMTINISETDDGQLVQVVFEEISIKAVTGALSEIIVRPATVGQMRSSPDDFVFLQVGDRLAKLDSGDIRELISYLDAASDAASSNCAEASADSKQD